ncbi:MAG TPA: hypothetical protein VG818_07475 [Gemmatimonadaceae bacterium]|jgi:hypothetical protein|nr:hypothetical protein [Gemmatimonadaceae bacterium]
MSHSHDHDHAGDMKAAFTGLILGAVVIFAILFSIVKLTNAHYAKEHPAAEQATG